LLLQHERAVAAVMLQREARRFLGKLRSSLPTTASQDEQEPQYAAVRIQRVARRYIHRLRHRPVLTRPCDDDGVTVSQERDAAARILQRWSAGLRLPKTAQETVDPHAHGWDVRAHTAEVLQERLLAALCLQRWIRAKLCVQRLRHLKQAQQNAVLQECVPQEIDDNFTTARARENRSRITGAVVAFQCLFRKRLRMRQAQDQKALRATEAAETVELLSATLIIQRWIRKHIWCQGWRARAKVMLLCQSAMRMSASLGQEREEAARRIQRVTRLRAAATANMKSAALLQRIARGAAARWGLRSEAQHPVRWEGQVNRLRAVVNQSRSASAPPDAASETTPPPRSRSTVTCSPKRHDVRRLPRLQVVQTSEALEVIRDLIAHRRDLLLRPPK
jgi:hypothetical protein